MFFKSSGLFSAVVFCLAVSAFCVSCFADALKSPYAAQKDILTLIDAGDYASAEAAVVKMAGDFAGDKILARKLWEVANRYDKVEAYSYSRRLCEQIIANHPADAYSTYAALQLTKLAVYELIDAGQYETGYAAAEEMLGDFAGHKQVCRRVWEAANRYEKVKAVEYSRRICERIVSAAGKDEYGKYAALELAKLEAFDLIEAGDMETAGAAVSRMTSRFAGHRQLSRRLYETAQMYAKRGAFGEARALHSRVAAAYPKDDYGSRSAIAAAKLGIYELIDANDFAAAEAAISKMKSDFAGEYLYEALDSVAERYDKAGEDDRAKEVWRQIIEECGAESKAVVGAKARLAKHGLIRAIESGDTAGGDTVIAQLKSEFADVQNRRLAMFTLAEDLYGEALRYPPEGQGGRAADYLRRVAAIEENEVVDKIGRGGEELDACTVLAEAYERLGDYTKSIEYCQRVLRDYPGSRYCWSAQFMIGQCYENMIAAGQIEQSQAEPEIRDAYTKLLEKHPRCAAAAAARSWLDGQ